jgi:hypothetical protein
LKHIQRQQTGEKKITYRKERSHKCEIIGTMEEKGATNGFLFIKQDSYFSKPMEHALVLYWKNRNGIH